MDITKDPIIALVEKFLGEHFPNEDIQIRAVGPEFAVDLGTKLNFRVLGTTVYNVVIHKDHYNAIAPLFGVDTYRPESTVVLNDFFESLNADPIFSKMFEPLPLVDFSHYIVPYSKHEDDYVDLYDADKRLRLISKHGKSPRTSIIQFAFRFSENNTLTCLPAVAIFLNDTVSHHFGFNLQTKTVYRITETVLLHEDFFIKNKPLDVQVDIQKFILDFVDNTIVDFEKSNGKNSVDIDSISFDDKIELFKMMNI